MKAIKSAKNLRKERFKKQVNEEGSKNPTERETQKEKAIKNPSSVGQGKRKNREIG